MAWSPDGRLFVSEKNGSLRVVKNGHLLAEPFMRIAVDTRSERGLMGVAFDPHFASNGYVYAFYTTSASKNRVSRFTASAANPDLVAPNSERVLLDNIPSDAANHNGGAVHFGRDGKLYIAVGDSGFPQNSQNLGNLAGKMLRINADGSVPADNPFVGQSGRRPEIWAYGLRNPYTFAFKSGTSTLFINDVGNNTWEEINSGSAGANYGWPTCEGACNRSGFVDPTYAYRHVSGSGSSITGGVFYDGHSFPADISDDYFFADYVGGFIKRYDPSTGQVSGFATSVPSPVDLRIGPDGALYYLSVEARMIGRIAFTGGSVPTPTPTPPSTPTPRGHPPVPVIDTPTSGTTYRAGSTIHFSGHATDAEDGTLAASHLEWEVVFHHDTHTHPFLDSIRGTTYGSLTIPTAGEAAANTWYRIHLRATDSDGNVAEFTRDIRPRTTRVTLTTVPTGLTVLLDGTPVRTPYSFVGVEGFLRQLTAPATQSLNGQSYGSFPGQTAAWPITAS